MSEHTGLIERLRTYRGGYFHEADCIVAATLLERREAENAKLRACVEELLDFVPYEKPELGPLPNWICEIKARAEAALAKARVE